VDWKGDKVILSNSAGFIRVLRDGSNPVFLGKGQYCVLSNDGSYAAYQDNNYSAPDYRDLFAIRTDGSGKTKITDYESTYLNLMERWSPAGDKLAYNRYPRVDGNQKLYITSPDGTGQFCLNPALNSSSIINFGSNGRIVYTGNNDIWVGDYGAPALLVTPSALDLPEVKKGEIRTVSFTITNTGGGELTGTITCSDSWVTVTPASFSAAPVTVELAIDCSGIPLGQNISVIQINTNAGSQNLSVGYNVTCVLAKPNPARLTGPSRLSPQDGQTAHLITFYGSGIVPGATSIKIYTLSGELIKEVHSPQSTVDSGQEIYWDGNNENGQLVSNGIYLYTYESPREKGVGKFTVVR